MLVLITMEQGSPNSFFSHLSGTRPLIKVTCPIKKVTCPSWCVQLSQNTYICFAQFQCK